MAKRIAVKVDEYEKEGQVKGKYVEIGVILSNENGEYVLLDPTVNLAGVLQQQNMLAHKKGQQVRNKVAASIFDNSQQGQQQGGWGQPQQPQPQQRPPQQQAPQRPSPSQPRQQAPQYNEPPMDFDDDIPFMRAYHQRHMHNCI